MKTSEITKRSFKVFGMTGAMFLAVLFMNGGPASFKAAGMDLGGQALAAEGGSGQGAHGANKGGQGTHGASKGGKGSQGMSKVLDPYEETDSDKPVWAGGSKELNPHRGTGNPTPGTNKGDTYGDLWVVVRNPVTGEPILVNGEQQVCLDAACTQTVLTVDGELPEGVVPAEVDLGRTNVVRAPTKVTDHALNEVISKIASATTITLDPAGRLVLDGVTVDSPLENLALYIAIRNDDPRVMPYLDKLREIAGDDNFWLSAALLAAGSDKTNDITIDYVMYFNEVAGGTKQVSPDLDYDRSATFDGTITYYVQDADGNVTQVTKSILDAVFGGENIVITNGGVSAFTQEADDALKVIEFIHTQVHTE